MNSKATISLALFFAGSAVAPVLAQANDPNENSNQSTRVGERRVHDSF